jgi:hypothetical protein
MKITEKNIAKIFEMARKKLEKAELVDCPCWLYMMTPFGEIVIKDKNGKAKGNKEAVRWFKKLLKTNK